MHPDPTEPANESVKKKNKTTIKLDDDAKKEIQWATKSFASYIITSYAIQQYIEEKCSQKMIDTKDKDYEFDLGDGKKKMITTSGIFHFTIDGKLYKFSTSYRDSSSKIYATEDCQWLKEEIDLYIKNNNPIKNKHLHLFQTTEGISFHIKPTPTEVFDDVVIDEKKKEDIQDNVIGNLKLVDDNNGLILWGPPGTGKSLICRATINGVINAGFSSCYTTTDFNFDQLEDFIQSFLAPCLIVFEDIDTIGKSRETTENSNLANFLQFLSGLNEREQKIVFMATTNHLNKLDDAIKNRPVRFNRIIEIPHPTNDQIKLLITKQFKAEVDEKLINEDQMRKCYDEEWTGAHVHELKRTCKLYSKKRNKKISDVFDESVQMVKESFSMNVKRGVGFRIEETSKNNKVGFSR